MPYLSRIYLNPLRTPTQVMLRNPRVLHAAVLGGLARQPVTERVLWRLEAPNPHQLALLVLTDSTPSWEHLVEQAGWQAADEPQAIVKPYEPLLDQLQRGREFAFRLKANPTSSTKQPTKPSTAQEEHLAGKTIRREGQRPRGVRVAHRTLTAQLDWITRQLTRAGFDLPTDTVADNDVPAVRVTDRTKIRFDKPGTEDKKLTVALESATFDGLIRVTDPTAARQALLNGIGTGKAYGFGLLTLAPPRRTTPTT